jgi:hypothetical protein
MQVLLSPSNNDPNQLRRIYARALREATEIYIASAYLTDWAEDQAVGKLCKQIVFVVGTDFGLSRKAAMRSVLHWMPKRGSCTFLAVPSMAGGGFHPKIVAWRTKGGRCYTLTGSSNLSKAAFSGNCEANIFSEITDKQFRHIEEWLEPLIAKAVPITEDWIDNHYKEAPVKASGGAAHSLAPPVKLVLPEGPTYAQAVRERRKQQGTFKEIKRQISTDVRRCAEGKMGDSECWRCFWEIWSGHESRFQGSGIQFSGKSAKWRQACRALVAILQADRRLGPQHALDAVVSREIDRLAQLRNPARGAWLSEMLCHYFPDLYPIRNSPVTKWLGSNKWRGRRGSSEGQRYVELAKQLRYAVLNRPAGARNLAELDYAIWLWVQNRGL